MSGWRSVKDHGQPPAMALVTDGRDFWIERSPFIGRWGPNCWWLPFEEWTALLPPLPEPEPTTLLDAARRVCDLGTHVESVVDTDRAVEMSRAVAELEAAVGRASTPTKEPGEFTFTAEDAKVRKGHRI